MSHVFISFAKTMQNLDDIKEALQGFLKRPMDDADSRVITKLQEIRGIANAALKKRKCYICKRSSISKESAEQSCETCVDVNNQHRSATADMRGMTCIVTGCRVKIGFEICLALLRMGARVIGTTRFPADAIKRYLGEKDGQKLVQNLTLYAVDFRDIRTLRQFAQAIEASNDHLHVIINNAAQTIRRPPAFYQHLLENEQKLQCSSDTRRGQCAVPDKGGLGAVVHNLHEQDRPFAAALTQLVLMAGDGESHDFPVGSLDADGQQIDLREQLSWSTAFGQVDPVELTEVFLINAIAPFILTQDLLATLRRTSGKKFIVNVSAMEGKFNRRKSACHPHTNMAKSALNQWVKTSGEELAREMIYMTAVDTGWVTDERPFHQKQDKFVPPLDSKDGATRVLHPIIEGLNGGRLFAGVFLKDYAETTW